MNVEKRFYLKNFDDSFKNCQNISDFITGLFRLVSDETVNLSHKHISMTTQFSGPKAFTLNFISA